MEASEIQDVCRLCPENGISSEPLLNVFNRKFGDNINMKDVIFITTGIEISESDLISTKICAKCYENTKNIHKIRQTAMQQDRHLKEKCHKFLVHRGLRLPNTCITIKCPPSCRESTEMEEKSTPVLQAITIQKNALDEVPHCSKSNVVSPPTSAKPKVNKGIHTSVVEVYRNNPKYRLPKKCLHRDIAPIVSLGMDEVESYFWKRKLDMFNYIYRPKPARQTDFKMRRVARKRTAVPFKAKPFFKPNSLYSPIPMTDVVEHISSGNKSVPPKKSGTNDCSIKRSSLPLKTTLIRKPGPKSKTLNFNRSPSRSGLNPPNATKPEFIQSLGLTPAMGLTKFPSILICKVCSLIHRNVAALKKHSSRHRVCEYCKLKFKSVERKKNHEESCKVKRILLGSPSIVVDLERVELNRSVRRQFSAAFEGFEDIPGLDDRRCSNIIVLTDDEDGSSAKDEVIELEDGAPSTSADPKLSVMESCSKLKPVIDICNNTVLDRLNVTNSSDKAIMKDLASLVNKLNNVEVQAEPLPLRDPVIGEGFSCKLKNFKSNLLLNVVPVKFTHGEFKVSYSKSSEEEKEGSKIDHSGSWSDVALIEERSCSSPSEMPVINTTTYPLTFVTSQVQSSQLSVSSIQLMTSSPTMSIFLPNTSAFLQGTGLSIQPNLTQPQTLNNTLFNQISNTSIQTTPLLQNYTLSMGPFLNNQIPVQTSSVGSTAAANTPPADCMANGQSQSTNYVDSAGSSGKSSHKELVLSKGDRVVVTPNILAKDGKSKSKNRKRPIIKVKIGNLASSRAAPRASRSSKLRVKNIWELK
ncbi:uncharacterized protein [Euwallacea similis]|uniref:uncharacterized protein isoform X2 n=1 Tax=Euwallacea similis TaxID=1736056 RepID=UPI00344F370C